MMSEKIHAALDSVPAIAIAVGIDRSKQDRRTFSKMGKRHAKEYGIRCSSR
jgi:hypothetical protein